MHMLGFRGGRQSDVQTTQCSSNTSKVPQIDVDFRKEEPSEYCKFLAYRISTVNAISARCEATSADVAKVAYFISALLPDGRERYGQQGDRQEGGQHDQFLVVRMLCLHVSGTKIFLLPRVMVVDCCGKKLTCFSCSIGQLA